MTTVAGNGRTEQRLTGGTSGVGGFISVPLVCPYPFDRKLPVKELDARISTGHDRYQGAYR